ncbi:hypothetical protein [uncultured Bacteroides sp.]|uniref:DUF3244 domain-containing protein n=1 Tax=uncultured Bacteroides sp. TaxID=162156 RepID=UPI0026193A26|nr:hypothetical protein [uncultured Bacteroides sp.]
MRNFILALLLGFTSIDVFATECLSDFVWNGNWKDETTSLSVTNEIPFYSEYIGGEIIIYNRNPDRLIYYKVVDKFDNILRSGIVSKENSDQIQISISDLSNNNTYAIILTSQNSCDCVSMNFIKL